MMTDHENWLSGRLTAVSHILAMTIKLIEGEKPGTIALIGDTLEFELRKHVGSSDDQMEVSFAEKFWMEAHKILDLEWIETRLEEGEFLPKPIT